MSNILSKAGVKTETWVEISSGDFGYNADFSEHDKGFEDKILELKKDYKTASDLLGKYQQENASLNQRIAELENELDKNGNAISSEIDTSTPLDCANSLINHLTHLEAFLIAPERDEKTFTIDDLEQIAEHLLVYCKHNKESE